MKRSSKRLKKKYRQYLVYSSIFLALILLINLFRIDIVQIIMATLLIIVGSTSRLYKKVIPYPLGFELLTIVVILFAYKLSIPFALGAMVFMILASDLLTERIVPQNLVLQFGTYVVIILLVALFRSVPYIPLAICMVILRNLSRVVIGPLLGAPMNKVIPGSVFNTILNILIILTFGNSIVNLL